MAQSDPNSSDNALSELSIDIAVDSIPDALLVVDPNTNRIVDANTTAGDLFHCQPTELIGCQQSDLHPQTDGNYVEAFRRGSNGQRVDRLQNGEPLYIETLDGQHIPVEINAKRVDTSDGVVILGVFREITAQLDRQRRLEATTTRLETLLDALPIPVAVLDTDGTVERWNQAAETTFGYAATAVEGEPYPLFIEDGEFDESVSQVLDGSLLDGYETTHRTEGGSVVPVELFARPLYEDGTLTGIIGVAIDLSDRKQREQQLDVLHRVLRHNLRNELTVITGRTEQLAADDVDNGPAIEKIEDASNRLLELSAEATRIRTTLSSDTHQQDTIPISEGVSALTQQLTGQGSATMRVGTIPESGAISQQGLHGLSHLLDSIVTHVEETTVELLIETRPRHLTVTVSAPVSILPPGVQSFIHTGEETALAHGSDLTLQKSYLMIESIGGDVTIETEAELTSDSTLSVELPRMDESDT